MNATGKRRTLLFLPMILALLMVSGRARPVHGMAQADQLHREIAALDAAVFDAYNRCQLDKFGAFFTEQLEFYHDNGGLTARSRQDLVEALRKNICGKVRRELVPGTLEVYPLHGYGALEMGMHRFHHPGREEIDGVGEAKFIHLWRNQGGAWKITRVISYDHHPLAQ